MKKKCKVRIVATVTAYIQFDSNGQATDFDEIDDIQDIEDWEVLDVIF